MFKKLTTKLAVILVSVASVFAVTTSTALAYSDGVYFTQCTSRWLLTSRSAGGANMYVYMCGYGYTFTQVNSPGRSYNMYAQMVRQSPFRNEYVTSYNTYGVTSTMAALLRGSCYTAQGWTPYSGVMQASFCYR
jgi:hypothetical protein